MHYDDLAKGCALDIPPLFGGIWEARRQEPEARITSRFSFGRNSCARVELSAGDHLFFYTDGLTDAENPKGEEVGTARLEKPLLSERKGGLEAILTNIEAAAREYLGGKDAPDDATMMLVKIGI